MELRPYEWFLVGVTFGALIMLSFMLSDWGLFADCHPPAPGVRYMG